MNYLVSKKYLRGAAIPCAEFMDLNDAKLFIEKKLEVDARISVKVDYFISRSNEIIATFEADKILASRTQEDSGAGKGSSASFRPTPFNTAPRPPGTPQKWIKEDDEEKDENRD
ncbi:hypothetical protein AQUSIP_02120 [Aquicella siphonis]|uniref:Uncharacterized protein n=1 Tax=Aquicella siphonis TaxID=254247 RepID=A0A5E4PEM9_9COXI|nr:hypothetical protein [Aquicella siphonis]VVC74938.1 hypothetical protein AQUSIP_02120 [Aquicella siphonis]